MKDKGTGKVGLGVTLTYKMIEIKIDMGKDVN